MRPLQMFIGATTEDSLRKVPYYINHEDIVILMILLVYRRNFIGDIYEKIYCIYYHVDISFVLQ